MIILHIKIKKLLDLYWYSLELGPGLHAVFLLNPEKSVKTIKTIINVI